MQRLPVCRGTANNILPYIYLQAIVALNLLHNTLPPFYLCITLLHRIVSGSGTSSPLHPLGLTTVIVPDFSIGAVTSLINLLKNGTTTTNGPQVAEVIELARVLELKELEQEEVSGGLDLAGAKCSSAGISPARRPWRVPARG